MPYRFKTTPIRSNNMRAIRSVNNATTERRIRAYFCRLGISGWHIRPIGVPGCPDFVFPAQNLAIFVDGCFWHCCPQCGHIPKSNVSYWKAKLSRNQRRDRAVTRELRACGFTVIRLWECAVKHDPQKCLSLIVRELNTRKKPARAPQIKRRSPGRNKKSR